ncbi:MAG: toxic anion resistance protein [Geminicoccaceae bacterium]|nr:toxic anion resistance protein [Geminicoccaceae bacterium]MCB9944468.1 toxic anion resistance protein [Geminicoccaceae bacterium]
MSEQPEMQRTAPPPLPVATAELADSIQVLSRELAHDLQIDLDGDASKAVAQAVQEIDMGDTSSIIFFGSKAQQQLTTISDSMLEEVRTKDVGPAGQALNTMVSKLRELKFEDIDPTDKPNWFERMLGMGNNKLQDYLDQYETVREQIDGITNDLERHKTTLLTDITKLDKLYDANLDYFRTLEIYVAAGRAKLKELDETIIPKLAEAVGNQDDVIQSQKLRDLRSARDDLERRVHDLLLTRQVTMQSLPSIRLVQENDKSLITKINSTLANTVPLWRQQLAQAITVYRSGQAADAVKAATDLTNDLLKSNADNLRQVNQQVREQVERGVFDIDTVRAANEQLIATIEDSLRIADEGKVKRREAEHQLAEAEHQLKEALQAASARAETVGKELPKA